MVEHALAHIEEAAVHDLPEEQQRWYAIKVFERDEKVVEQLKISPETLAHIENDIQAAEREQDDDAESIITNERYIYIAEILKGSYKKKEAGKLSTSDKIDKVVTNRWLALPIFAVIMFLVYFVSVTTVGSWATDWANDGVFGDSGWYFLGIGWKEQESREEEFGDAKTIVEGYMSYAAEQGYDTEELEEKLDTESEDFDADEAKAALTAFVSDMKADEKYGKATYEVTDEETAVTETEVTQAAARAAAQAEVQVSSSR